MNVKHLATAAVATAFLSITALSSASPVSAAPPPPDMSRRTTVTLTASEVAALPQNNGANTTFSMVEVWDDDPTSIGAVVYARWDCNGWSGGPYSYTESTSDMITTVNQPSAGASMAFTYALYVPCSLTYTYPTRLGTPQMTIRDLPGPGIESLSIRHY